MARDVAHTPNLESSTVAPSRSASVTYRSIRSFASREMTGPKLRTGTTSLACSTSRRTM